MWPASPRAIAACAPTLSIAGVLIALSEQERDRHATLYDSTRLAHAVDYLFALGERLYGHPIPTVINISLGTNGHAHDGTSAISQWIDRALMTPGRCVCVAAGNAGQEAPQFAGDLGFLTGRIHASGQRPRPRARNRSRMAGRRQRHRRRLGKRDGNLVRSRATSSTCACGRHPASGSARWRPGTYVENQRLDERNIRLDLQRALQPGERRQPHLDFSQPASEGSRRRHRSGHVDRAAARRRGPQRTIRRLDRARRSAAARSHRRGRRLALPVVLLVAQQRRSFVGQLAGLRASASFRWATARTRPNGSTSHRARDRRATAATSRRSPRPAATSSRPAASRRLTGAGSR